MALTTGALAAITIATTAFQAVGGFVQAQQQAADLDFQAQVDRRNARLTKAAAASDAEDERLENRRKLASIRASYAANGVGGAGTSLDVLEDAATEGNHDIAKIKYNGEVKAIGLLDSADQKSNAARGTRSRAGFSLATGLLGAGADGITELNRTG